MGRAGLLTSAPAEGPWAWGSGSPGAYLGLADGAVEGIVLLVIEEAEVQRAQGGCGQRTAQVTHQPHGELSPTPARAY